MTKAGDIVLVDGTGFGSALVRLGNFWTRIFKRKKSVGFTHIGIMISEESIVEALNNGVVQRKFPYTKDFKIFRNIRITEDQIKLIVATTISQIGDRYDHGLLVGLGILKLLRLEKFVKLDAPKGKICSLVVAKAYESIGYRFRPEEDIELVDPADISDDILFRHDVDWIDVTETVTV